MISEFQCSDPPIFYEALNIIDSPTVLGKKLTHMYALGIFALGNIHTVNLNNYGFDVHCESIKNMPNTKTKNTKH